ncbi:MAG: hypothetical protein AB7P03_12175 [Kofleriaceae bacterium]
MPLVAAAENRTRVGVITPIAVNIEASRVDSLSQDLVDALVAELDIDAVGGIEARRQLPPEGVPADCLVIPSCVAEVARRLSATQLLFLAMVDTGEGGAIQVDSTWVDVESGKSMARPAIAIAGTNEAKARFTAVARQLLPDAAPRVRATGPAAPAGKVVPGVPRHLTLAAKLTAGGAVVGLGLGIGFGLKTRSAYEDCEALRDACSNGKRQSIRTSGLIADLSFVAATGFAIATVVLFYTSSREASLLVTPEQGGAAVTAVGRF